MIEINLLPEELKKKRVAPHFDVSKVDLNKLPVVNIASIAVGSVIAIQIILFMAGVVCGIYFNSLDKSYKVLLPQKQEVEGIKLRIDRLSKKVGTIDELMVKRFSWAKKLNDLSDSITPGIWLTDLAYEEKLTDRTKTVNVVGLKNKPEKKIITEKVISKYLVLSGAASSQGEEGTALIGRFIKNLKSNPDFYSDFSDIELGTIKREKADDQEIMIFKITCLFKEK